jgi:predicted nucleotidyltransferase
MEQYMGIDELLKANRDAILKIAAKHGARNIRVFGSVARGDADEKSDVDFLVVLDERRSLMDHAAMIVELENLLGRKVDVAPEDCLRPRIKDRVLKEAVPL